MKRIITTITIVLLIQISLLAIGFVSFTSKHNLNLESIYVLQLVEINKYDYISEVASLVFRYVEPEPQEVPTISY